MNELTAVARMEDLPPGRTAKFVLTRDGREIEAFVLNHGGRLVAYVNRCCHIPMTMDWVENQFLSDDGAHILCATHGALYEPESGECVAGPPLGKCLTAVPLEIRDGQIWAAWPDGE
ncbi:MAG TPA: Rieske 2Fe-2S domain-containing protein [Candidatus Dormibacteraeota bacterium]|nr:Rieske 2Fe-2S domain-containing protein [Candidatus Dormibacteraeota bacterium]